MLHGYLERVPDPGDGRAKLVVPTRRGRAAHAEARRTFAELERERADEDGGEALRTLRDTLERLDASFYGFGAGPQRPGRHPARQSNRITFATVWHWVSARPVDARDRLVERTI